MLPPLEKCIIVFCAERRMLNRFLCPTHYELWLQSHEAQRAKVKPSHLESMHADFIRRVESEK